VVGVGGVTEPAGELVRKMAGGDRLAFERFYDRYAPLVYALVRRIVREPADAAEVLQDVFWEAWEAAGRYDPGRGTVEAWLLMRARTRAIDRLRAVRRQGVVLSANANTESGRGVPVDPARNLGDAAGDRLDVTAALEVLPEAERRVLALAYWEGLTQTEIAERLGQPLGTVKTRMRQGLGRLRDIMRRRQG
jgi:RNA polymerase sigma-70 factor (ECF subfamily)